MVGDYVYAVINEHVIYYQDEINLPRIDFGDGAREVPAAEIYYGNVTDSYYMFTTIVAVNTQDDDEEPAYESILLGASSNIYVSRGNIYITYTMWGNGGSHSETTAIHRIAIEDGECVITDLQSTNGTFVGGRQISEETLHPGDEVRIGLTTFRLEQIDEDQSQTDTKPLDTPS